MITAGEGQEKLTVYDAGSGRAQSVIEVGFRGTALECTPTPGGGAGEEWVAAAHGREVSLFRTSCVRRQRD